MKTSAIPSPISADKYSLGNRYLRNARASAGGTVIALMLACSLPAAAQTKDKEPEKPVTDTTVTVGDVARRPPHRLNPTPDGMPAQLIQAREDPYNNTGFKKCAQISTAVGQLDAILGDDLDIAGEKSNAVNAGRVAKWAVSRFIPFRGLIREISGASEHERQFQDAIVAGMMRRSYLKGLGEAKGCKYPARPADEATISRIAYERQVALTNAEQVKADKKSKDAQSK